MDPALLRERELFKKKALSTPSVIDSHKVKVDVEGFSRSKSIVHSSGSSGSKHYNHSSNGLFNLKSVCLATIDQYMKTRHQTGQTHFLTLEEILDGAKLQDIVMDQKQWLSEYLVKNPKIEAQDGKFAYKPKYKLKNKKSLLRLLEKHEQLGLGGVFLDDVEEGLPNSTSVMKALEDQIISVTRPDKKKVLFYNDKQCQFVVEEKFQKCWRSVPVDSLEDEKIVEYLKTQGFSREEKGRSRVFSGQKRRKKATTAQKKRRFNTHNIHLLDVLEDYSEEEIQKGLMRTL